MPTDQVKHHWYTIQYWLGAWKHISTVLCYPFSSLQLFFFLSLFKCWHVHFILWALWSIKYKQPNKQVPFNSTDNILRCMHFKVKWLPIIITCVCVRLKIDERYPRLSVKWCVCKTSERTLRMVATTEWPYHMWKIVLVKCNNKIKSPH